jgi:hypothetical protein
MHKAALEYLDLLKQSGASRRSLLTGMRLAVLERSAWKLFGSRKEDEKIYKTSFLNI